MLSSRQRQKLETTGTRECDTYEQCEKRQTDKELAAEYLTFVVATGGGVANYEVRYEDENIWLMQKMMAALHDVTKQALSQHINRIYADGELTPEATVKKYLTVQTEKKC